MPSAPRAIFSRMTDHKQQLPADAIYRIRIAACYSLLRFAIGTAQESGSIDAGEGNAQRILVSVFCRSTRTYEAIVRRLAKGAFGEQAAMLNRSLFEDMVDAHWIHLYPAVALERLPQHDRWSRHLRAKVQREYADFFDDRQPPEQDLTEEEVTELTKLFGERGDGSWTEIGLHQRYQAILPYWESKEDQRYMRWVKAWIHKLNNETLHPSAFSLARLAGPQPAEEGVWHYRFGSTKEWLSQALSCAFWTYEKTFRLAATEVYKTDLGQDYKDKIESPFERAFKMKLPKVDEGEGSEGN